MALKAHHQSVVKFDFLLQIFGGHQAIPLSFVAEEQCIVNDERISAFMFHLYEPCFKI